MSIIYIMNQEAVNCRVHISVCPFYLKHNDNINHVFIALCEWYVLYNCVNITALFKYLYDIYTNIIYTNKIYNTIYNMLRFYRTNLNRRAT